MKLNEYRKLGYAFSIRKRSVTVYIGQKVLKTERVRGNKIKRAKEIASVHLCKNRINPPDPDSTIRASALFGYQKWIEKAIDEAFYEAINPKV